MSSVLVALAEGCEELEAVTVIDLLRRAGIEVTAAGLEDGPVKASRGTVLVPDVPLDEALKRSYDMVVLPGGLPGAEYLAADSRILDLLRATAEAGNYVCAICAAPAVLAKAGLLDGKRTTAYPGVLDSVDVPGMTDTGGAVEQDGNVVTSRGPGTAMDFALHLIEALAGAEKRRAVEKKPRAVLTRRRQGRKRACITPGFLTRPVRPLTCR